MTEFKEAMELVLEAALSEAGTEETLYDGDASDIREAIKFVRKFLTDRGIL